MTAQPSMKATMTEEFGREHMRRSPSRDELYDAVDVLVYAVNHHKATLGALDGRLAMVEARGEKARVRVPAIRGEVR